MRSKIVKRFWPLVLMLSLLLPLFVSCDNPFDPLDESSEIEGLSYFDWTGSWERWDPDPEYDGYEITMEYFNEFGDSLEFKNKDHTITIEFYTQKVVDTETSPETGEPIAGTGFTTFDKLVFSQSVTFENTDDDIRIPKEVYADALRSSGFSIDSEDSTVYIILRVFPPNSKPQNELVVGYPDQIVYKPDQGITPNA